MIYFIRHWKTISNLSNLINWGEINENILPTNDKIFNDTEFKNKISEINPEYIFSSSLIRAIQTAEKINLINWNKAKIIIDEKINEQKFWEYSWNKFEDLLNKNPEYSNENIRLLWRKYNKKWETWNIFLKRIELFIKQLKKSELNWNILIVAHWWTFLALNQLIFNLNDDIILNRKYYIENLEIKEILI